MEHAIEAIIRETLNASNEGRIHFGQVIGTLVSTGVESYSVDYRTCRATYYMPCGETLALELGPQKVEIAEKFSSSGIKAAILGAQRGEVMYPQFKQLSQAAGCVGYTVWLAGRHVSYFGRKGETHVEHFPN
ncbi:DUF1398 domain-containing protein [Herbaspirillum rhizosphaerae]|uniref:DUF1398 domain-containing protein n=1 Tax=Herbaspirillum rhizosphaerae TaxID=346179 RepID=A0ABW8ZAI5_9BURK